MEPINANTLKTFLVRVGELQSQRANLYLLGGSALLLLGNPRQTLDIDYTTDLSETNRKTFEKRMSELAAQFGLEIHAVPLGEFIPLPEGFESRRKWVGQYGQLDV